MTIRISNRPKDVLVKISQLLCKTVANQIKESFSFPTSFQIKWLSQAIPVWLWRRGQTASSSLFQVPNFFSQSYVISSYVLHSFVLKLVTANTNISYLTPHFFGWSHIYSGFCISADDASNKSQRGGIHIHNFVCLTLWIIFHGDDHLHGSKFLTDQLETT